VARSERASLTGAYAYRAAVASRPVRGSTAAAWLFISSVAVACRSEGTGSCPPCPSAPVCGPGGPIIASSALPLDLPKAAQGQEVQLVLEVEIHANEELKADGKVVADTTALIGVAKAAVAKSPDVRAVIRADKDAKHGRVIAVLDALKQAGISKIAFGVAPVGSATP